MVMRLRSFYACLQIATTSQESLKRAKNRFYGQSCKEARTLAGIEAHYMGNTEILQGGYMHSYKSLISSIQMCLASSAGLNNNYYYVE